MLHPIPPGIQRSEYKWNPSLHSPLKRHIFRRRNGDWASSNTPPIIDSPADACARRI